MLPPLLPLRAGTAHVFPGENSGEGGIHVIVGAADFLFEQETGGNESFQIFGGGETGHVEIVFEECDFCVGVGEEVVDGRK